MTGPKYLTPFLGRELIAFALIGLFFISNAHTQSFSSSNLSGFSVTNPTCLEFGPDQRLYVSSQDGLIYALTIVRNGPDDYEVTSTETISAIQTIANHNDDGSFFSNDIKRQITGLHLTGTIMNPVIYVTSSDYRIGGGGIGGDENLDTNSGIVTRLSWNGSSWDRVHLVRGLPRSEENHSTNGLFLDDATNTLYVAQGGNTNAGAPSNNFAFLTEYALATCVLKIDLTALEAMLIKSDTASGEAYIYDLPTLDDPERPNANGIDDPLAGGYDGIDIHDPFGGNDGLNQAKLVPGGPVQIHASGFRNIYDVLISEAGHMYTWDNGANVGWGGHPDSEGVGTATNNWVPGEPGSDTPGPNDDAVNNEDGFHLISGLDYYGGHPNPVRANPDSSGLFTHPDSMSGGSNGIWRTQYLAMSPDSSLPYDWPPVPSSMANPIEGDFQNPGVDNLALYTHEESTNGIVEYTASNFNGAMQGDILGASFEGKLYRVDLNASGTINSPSDVSVLATGYGIISIDVETTGDGGPFPGSIWVADYIASEIAIFEPQDFIACTGVYDVTLDEDVDGYTNADEIDNGTDPCNGISTPDDFDKTLIGSFLVSNLNDPDDDDDGIVDSLDFFAWDPMNGLNTQIPIDYPLLNGDPGIGFYGLGFTGLMSNGQNDYLELWKTEDNSEVEIVAGGAVGLFTINNVSDGDAIGSINDQHNAFQFGLDVNIGTAPFTIETKFVGPPFIDTAQNFQSAGIFIGNGDQDNYLKFAVNANGGTPGLRVTTENLGVAVSSHYAVPAVDSASQITFYLDVNPGLGTVQPRYALNVDPDVALGTPILLSDSLLSVLQNDQALAIGVISTSRGTDSTFNATWDEIKIDYTPITNTGQWIVTNDGQSCQPLGQPGSCCEGRHENAFVEVGDKFYLIGGRENNSNVNIYDPATDTWTVGADAPVSLHHFQAVELDGLIWVVGAFSGNFPSETPADKIYIYDPINDTWYDGATIPASRRRGSGGAVTVDGVIYWMGGIENGHIDGWVNWLDRFDPETNTWDSLSFAPHSRDHFQLLHYQGELYAAGGRRTNEMGSFFLPYEQHVDVYNISQGNWTTMTNTLPTGRAGAMVSMYGNELLVIGGERHDSISATVTTEAMDIIQGSWRSLAPLNVGRHATQVIANNGGLYIAAGSPNQGEATTQVTEAFYMNTQTSPILQNIQQAQLIASADTIDFGEVNSADTVEVQIILTNASDDQGLLVTDMSLLNEIDYEIVAGPSMPLFIEAGGDYSIKLQYHPDGIGVDISVLTLMHSGSTSQTDIFLSAAGAALAPGVYINCGGPEVLLGDTLWRADQYFTAGETQEVNIEILNTTADTIFQTERYRNGSFNYNIPIDSGWYDVNLHLAELNYTSNGLNGWNLNARKFDVKIEGEIVLEDYNINAQNQPQQMASAIVETIPALITDGILNLRFVKVTNNTKINGISVIPRDCPPEGASCDDQNPYTIDDRADGDCGCQGVIPQYIYLEAECGTVGSEWTIENVGTASNGQSIKPPGQSSISGPKTDPEDLVIIPFFVSDSANFKIYGRVLTNNSSSDSYWIRVDESGPYYSWNTINNSPYTSTFEWSEVYNYISGPGIIPLDFDLDVGLHHIYVSYREPNSKLDQFFVTNTDSIPVGIVEEGLNCDTCMTNTVYESQDLYICSGDSVFVSGNYQTEPGIYTDTLISSAGCDSILISTLMAADTFYLSQTISICANDSLVVGDSVYTSSGVYLDTLQSTVGCDSIVMTTLTVYPIYQDTMSITICATDSVLIGGEYHSTTGFYFDSLTTIEGCDSILVTDLVILDTSIVSLTNMICAGDSLMIFGQYESQAGEFMQTFQNEFGCDSLVTIKLEVIPPTYDTIQLTICFPDSAFLQGEFQHTTGYYLDTLISGIGCDSIIVTDLFVQDTAFSFDTLSICEGDSIFLAGAFQDTAGQYVDTLLTQFGCDSVVQYTLNLWPTYLDTNEIDICTWDSLFVGNAYQDTTGTYVDTFMTNSGCDSIVITNLIVVDSCIWPGGTIIYVDSAAIGANTGMNWTDAYQDLRDAIALFEFYDNIQQIWVAAGTYFPTQTGDRNQSFELTDSIHLYGSFNGTETMLEQRDSTQLSSILSGDIGLTNDSTDNSYHLIEIDTAAKSVVIDGFILEEGVANGTGKQTNGAGIYTEGVARLKHVQLRKMSSVSGGRVIFLDGVLSKLTLEKVVIIDPGPESVRSENGAQLIMIRENEIQKE